MILKLSENRLLDTLTTLATIRVRKVMYLLTSYHFLVLWCSFMPALASRKTVKGTYNVSSDKVAKFAFLRPSEKQNQDVDPNGELHPNIALDLSKQTFDLDYKMDELSDFTSLNGPISGRNHSRIARDVYNASKGEETTDTFEYPYEYEAFHREYFDYIWEKRNDSKMEPSRFYSKFEKISPLKETYTCFPDDWESGVGGIALYCTLRRGSTKGFTSAEFSRLGYILKFWAIVYIVAGGMLWMVCGWCCCCLRCKIFNPDEIRKEARCYVINNPPGVMRNKHTGNTIEYMPNQEEKAAHKELEIKAFAFV